MELVLFDQAGRRKYVTHDEALRFLNAAAHLPLQPRLFCFLLAFTGCRISEALALTPSHISVGHTGAGMVTFRTLKRRKRIFRQVPVPDMLAAALLAFGDEDDAKLFDLHRTTAYRWVKHAMRHCALSGAQACPKGLRHGFGIRAAIAKVPPNLIQRWLGHASAATTATYLDAVGMEERGFAEQAWRTLPPCPTP